MKKEELNKNVLEIIENNFKSKLYILNIDSYLSCKNTILNFLEDKNTKIQPTSYLNTTNILEYIIEDNKFADNLLEVLISINENSTINQSTINNIKENLEKINKNKKNVLLYLDKNYTQNHIIFFLDNIQRLDSDIDISLDFHEKSQEEQFSEIQTFIMNKFVDELRQMTESEENILRKLFTKELKDLDVKEYQKKINNISNINNITDKLYLFLITEFNKISSLFQKLYSLNISILNIENELTVVNSKNIDNILEGLDKTMISMNNIKESLIHLDLNTSLKKISLNVNIKDIQEIFKNTYKKEPKYEKKEIMRS